MDQDKTWRAGRPRRWPHCVTWGPSPLPQRGQSPPIFGPYLLWPNGWMDQDVTRYGVRTQPRRLCVRWRPSLRHILRQFTKFVLRDLKYSQDMTRCHSNYDVRLFRFRICIWHMYPFYLFVTEPARTHTSIHSTKRTALPQYGH